MPPKYNLNSVGLPILVDTKNNIVHFDFTKILFAFSDFTQALDDLKRLTEKASLDITLMFTLGAGTTYGIRWSSAEMSLAIKRGLVQYVKGGFTPQTLLVWSVEQLNNEEVGSKDKEEIEKLVFAISDAGLVSPHEYWEIYLQETAKGA